MRSKQNNIPERCCANCKFLIDYPKNNAYGDVEHLCVKLGLYIFGIHKDLDKAQFFMGDGKTPDRKAANKCTFERK